MSEEIEQKPKRATSKIAQELHEALIVKADAAKAVEVLQNELALSTDERAVTNFTTWENRKFVGYSVIVTPRSDRMEYIQVAK
jgi:hypothetical protein